MSIDAPDEPFLSRWSRQKQTDKRKPLVPETPVAAEEPEVDLARLPRIDDLTAESDISVFLRKGVPEALQKMALRRMWSLEPEIRNFVGMAENQWDFNAPGGIPGLFQELAEGTDVGVWLAQATQSVVREDPEDQMVVAEAKSPVENGRDLSPAQNMPTALTEADASDERHPATVADANEPSPPATQHAEAIERLPAAPNLPRSEKPPPRRRHGGALPA